MQQQNLQFLRQSELFTRTGREISKEEVSRNAQLLTRGGYINRLMAGVYSFLPLGMRVLNKIENIVRAEMNTLGAQEILMPALQPREIWDQTGRWDSVDVLFRFQGQGKRDLTLGPTHEEVVTPLVTSFIRSYRDLPAAVYQIQTKFRNETRARSGLLRGREFRMKDLYSFHASQADLDSYYDKVILAYEKIFKRCGIGERTLLTYASGGVFSKYSHEFQTTTAYGEDTIFRIPGKALAINKEIVADEEVLKELVPHDAQGKRLELIEEKAIEVGNIFKLGTRFSDAFKASFSDQSDTQCPIFMGCYGIGPSRIMGTIAECLSDEKGLVWPREVAPFDVHLISLARNAEESSACEKILSDLLSQGFSVLFDDRAELQAGERFNDCDLIGVPYRIVVSKKTLDKKVIELKARSATDSQILPAEAAFAILHAS